MTTIVPAEWARHRAMWLGFPSHPDLWLDDLAPARTEVEALARALTAHGGERVRLLTFGEEAAADAAVRFSGLVGVEVTPARFGDIWLRDTGPIFLRRFGAPAAAAFRFNGWGGKYDLPHDGEVAGQIATLAGVDLSVNDFVLEGGALDHDGAGAILTTVQCLLNPNRNAGWTPARAEAALAQALGARKVLWLGDGLANDHTDGHVDNLARFVRPGVVVCPAPFGPDDPNAAVYDEAARRLSVMSDAEGRRLEVVRIPSPGRMVNEDGQAIPASHMNFLIANRAVIMPTYGTGSAEAALAVLQTLFPDRAVIGLPSLHLLTGGGSFHCISQQEPA